MVGYLALNQADVGSTPTPATIQGSIRVLRLALNQEILGSNPSLETKG